jgi:hypothetical protein
VISNLANEPQVWAQIAVCIKGGRGNGGKAKPYLAATLREVEDMLSQERIWQWLTAFYKEWTNRRLFDRERNKVRVNMKGEVAARLEGP